MVRTVVATVRTGFSRGPISSMTLGKSLPLDKATESAGRHCTVPCSAHGRTGLGKGWSWKAFMGPLNHSCLDFGLPSKYKGVG